jgi:hypothetical protein
MPAGMRASLMRISPLVAGAAGITCFVGSSDQFSEQLLHSVAGMGAGIIGFVVMTSSINAQLR